MTKRKPAGMKFESWIDAQIDAATAAGEFENLPGHGQPLEDLGEADDPLWWAKKLLRREGLSVLPPALQIRARVEKTLESLGALESEAAVDEAVEALNAEIRRLNSRATGGPPTRQAPLDRDEVLARWRAARAAATEEDP